VVSGVWVGTFVVCLDDEAVTALTLDDFLRGMTLEWKVYNRVIDGMETIVVRALYIFLSIGGCS
jgi:hypothetical protein